MRRTRAGPASTTGTSAASPAASRRSSARRTSCRTTTTIRTRCAATGGSPPTSPPEASAIQETPTSFVSVSKWTRTHTNRLLFDAGFAVYDQQYNEVYQPDVFAVTPPLYTILDSATNKTTNGLEQSRRTLFEALHRAVRRIVCDRLALVAVRRLRQPGEMAAHAEVHQRRAAGHLQRRQARVRDAADPDRSAKLDQERQRACSPRIGGRSSGRRSTRACAGTGSSARPIPRASRPAPSTRPPNTRPALTARTTSPRAAWDAS